MHQEPSDEFKDLQRNLLKFSALAIVLPFEINPIILYSDEALVGNRYSVGVAAEILTSSGPPKGGLQKVTHLLA